VKGIDIAWGIGDEDIAKVKALLADQAESPLVRYRRRRNLAAVKEPVNRQQFWSTMIGARLTSQQLSGPESPIARFTRTTPFPLAYERMRDQAHLEAVISSEITRAGGIRFANRIGQDLAVNFRRLEGGEWDEALRQCNRLCSPVSHDIERQVAQYVDTFSGFGPKQSRNLLQGLGLTRFEIPIDSRVTAWLNRFGFPIRLSAVALNDPNYYNFVSDGFQALCARCDVFPCILDAAIFGARDAGGWTDANVIR